MTMKKVKASIEMVIECPKCSKRNIVDWVRIAERYKIHKCYYCGNQFMYKHS